MKYKLLEKESNGLHRIQALKSFGDVEKGAVGGYVESEHNLSQLGDCWIYDNSKVYGHAEVYGHAKVSRNSRVFGYAEVYGNDKVHNAILVSAHERKEV